MEIAQARERADSDRARSSVNKAEGLQPSSLDNFIASRRGGDRSDEGLWCVLFVLIPFLVIDKCLRDDSVQFDESKLPSHVTTRH